MAFTYLGGLLVLVSLIRSAHGSPGVQGRRRGGFPSHKEPPVWRLQDFESQTLQMQMIPG